MGHFIAEDDAGDAVGKGFAGQDFGVHGFMMKMLAGDAQGYIEHMYLASQRFGSAVKSSESIEIIIISSAILTFHSFSYLYLYFIIMLSINDYDYLLPADLIAQEPLAERDQARMLVLNRGDESITHSRFSRLPEWLTDQDVLVVNNTRVFPARLRGHKASGGRDGSIVAGAAQAQRKWRAAASG